MNNEPKKFESLPLSQAVRLLRKSGMSPVFSPSMTGLQREAWCFNASIAAARSPTPWASFSEVLADKTVERISAIVRERGLLYASREVDHVDGLDSDQRREFKEAIDAACALHSLVVGTTDEYHGAAQRYRIDIRQPMLPRSWRDFSLVHATVVGGALLAVAASYLVIAGPHGERVSQIQNALIGILCVAMSFEHLRASHR